MNLKYLGFKVLEKFIMAVMLATAAIMSYVTLIGMLALIVNPAHAAEKWAPTQPIEFVIPVGCCVGGANDMTRLIITISEKYNLLPHRLLPVNRPTGPASEGYVYIKEQTGNPHVLGFAITSIFTQELANNKSNFTYTDLTPISMLALDQFVLWTNSQSAHNNSQQFLLNAKSKPGIVSIGGLGVKQEDQIVVAAIENKKSVKFNYIPFKVGGDIAVGLAGGHIDASVNNPSEGLALWQAGKLKPLCVFDRKRMPNRKNIANAQSWHSIETCVEQGLDVQYKMMRSVFAAPGVDAEVVEYYENFFKKVVATDEWKQYMEQNALEPQFMTGQQFRQWLATAYQDHKQIMKESGWITK
jgi:putative tricarboxylic transport membrane protein